MRRALLIAMAAVMLVLVVAERMAPHSGSAKTVVVADGGAPWPDPPIQLPIPVPTPKPPKAR